MQIAIRVVPRSGKNSLEWEHNGLKARLTAPPVDGAANAALIELLSERLSVPKRAISLVRGATSRQKMVEITGLTLDDIEKRLRTSQ